MASAATAFDALAARYDELWSSTAIGMSQRRAVWSHIDPLFQREDSILDLGCGTGVDALHLQSRGVRVYAVDASTAMVEIARQKGVDAHRSPIEAIGNLTGEFDGAVSNFGALNCVENLASLGPQLKRLLRPGAFAALCLMSPFCLREILHFMVRARVKRAFRRTGHGSVRSSLGIDIRYPSIGQLTRAFRDGFELVRWYGVGVCVPPSYVRGITDETLSRLSRWDRRIAHLQVMRAMADHRLLVFKRI